MVHSRGLALDGDLDGLADPAAQHRLTDGRKGRDHREEPVAARPGELDAGTHRGQEEGAAHPLILHLHDGTQRDCAPRGKAPGRNDSSVEISACARLARAAWPRASPAYSWATRAFSRFSAAVAPSRASSAAACPALRATVADSRNLSESCSIRNRLSIRTA